MKNLILLVSGGAALMLACGNPPKEPNPGVETTSAGVVANKDVVPRIAQARCERAQRCNQFGVDKTYKDEAGCKSEVAHDLEADFTAKECPHGVRTERLNTCVLKTREEACGNVADKIIRVAACRKSELCID
ncbi:MAG TPA: DUF6184 family natural product biosynthesis lipoprotein [Labilithrix sp.]|nr:DUF6184 family natural product biosynthesis lipoprotein [Labilithrix sp.]